MAWAAGQQVMGSRSCYCSILNFSTLLQTKVVSGSKLWAEAIKICGRQEQAAG
jgi:hypothetical protein